MPVKLTVVGCSPSWPNPGGAQSDYLVDGSGRVRAYSGDSAPTERMAELARGADLCVCEATLERGDLDGEPCGHLSADEARGVRGVRREAPAADAPPVRAAA